MFRAICRSSSGAPTVFAASGLHTHVVNACNLSSHSDYGRSPHAYVNQRLQIQLGAPDDERHIARNMLSF